MEQLAAGAERASIKYKQVEYMSDHIGEVFDGVISGVTEWGLYIELEENKCEGLVPVRDLADDYYDFDERNYCLVGRKYNTRYRLGDKITVQVARADIQKRQLRLRCGRRKKSAALARLSGEQTHTKSPPTRRQARQEKA